MMLDLSNNGTRFEGLASLYDQARPAVPFYPVQILTHYLGRRPGKVVDLGCGPGISTQIWQGNCEEAIGVEPNHDMVETARLKEGEGLRFVQAFGHETGLPDQSVDIVVSSQAFHWMEPVSTLDEINRILVSGGIFSTIDYDWPPACGWKAELACREFNRALMSIDPTGPRQGIVRWKKQEHLKHIQESGHFIYCREILFASTQVYSADRMVDMAMSHSSASYIAEHYPEHAAAQIRLFRDKLYDILGTEEFSTDISYRMRMGVKR